MRLPIAALQRVLVLLTVSVAVSALSTWGPASLGEDALATGLTALLLIAGVAFAVASVDGSRHGLGAGVTWLLAVLTFAAVEPFVGVAFSHLATPDAQVLSLGEWARAAGFLTVLAGVPAVVAVATGGWLRASSSAS